MNSTALPSSAKQRRSATRSGAPGFEVEELRHLGRGDRGAKPLQRPDRAASMRLEHIVEGRGDEFRIGQEADRDGRALDRHRLAAAGADAVQAADLGAGGEMQRHDLGRRGLADAAVKPDHARLQATRAHVLGERVEARERLLDAGGDRSPGAVAANQETLGDEAVERLPDGGPRQLQALGQLTLAGERSPGLKQPAGQGGAHRHPELLVEHGRAGVGGAEREAKGIEERPVGSGGAHRFGHERFGHGKVRTSNAARKQGVCSLGEANRTDEADARGVDFARHIRRTSGACAI